MGRKRKATMSGLINRNGIWYVEKMVNRQRLRESTGSSNYEEAERYLIHRLEEIRLAQVYGMRPKRIFRDAAIKYLKENSHKRSIADDAFQIKLLDPYIGELQMERVHVGSLQPFIEMRRKQGVKNRTINKALQVVRHILNLATGEWLDEHGLTWMATSPKIKLLPEKDKASSYPLTWEEQERLFEKLPLYLRRMALFKVNTGTRDQEVCELRWEWEMQIPELNTSVFVIPGTFTKNELDRLVVLNDVAHQIVEEVRGEHPDYVFTCARWGNRIIETIDAELSAKVERRRLYQMNNNSWQKARVEAGLPYFRVHDLKHTFGRRLRAAGVSFEDRQDLLGHKSSRITTHYSAAEVQNLINAANKVCSKSENTPTITMLRTSNITSGVMLGHRKA